MCQIHKASLRQITFDGATNSLGFLGFDFLPLRHAGHCEIQVRFFHLLCFVDIVVNRTAVGKGQVFVVQKDVRSGPRSASVGELGALVNHVRHGVVRVSSALFHRGKTVVSLALASFE